MKTDNLFSLKQKLLHSFCYSPLEIKGIVDDYDDSGQKQSVEEFFEGTKSLDETSASKKRKLLFKHIFFPLLQVVITLFLASEENVTMVIAGIALIIALDAIIFTEFNKVNSLLGIYKNLGYKRLALVCLALMLVISLVNSKTVLFTLFEGGAVGTFLHNFQYFGLATLGVIKLGLYICRYKMNIILYSLILTPALVLLTIYRLIYENANFQTADILIGSVKIATCIVVMAMFAGIIIAQRKKKYDFAIK